MLQPIPLADRRPSPFRNLLQRAMRPLGGRKNFVRPATQALDPVFPCPSCENSVTVPASQAGKRGRCRHCCSPIRNAAPDRGQPAVDLSKDVHTISHPEQYPLSGHRATPIDYIPRGALAAMPLLVLVAVGIALLSLLPKGDARRGIAAAAGGPTPIQLLTSPAHEAEQLVSDFLNAPDWTHGVAHVFDGLAVADQIAALTEHLPAGGFSTSSKINEDGTSTVRVNFRDGTLTHFQVANIDGEDKILWDALPDGMPFGHHSRMVGMPDLEPK